MADPHFETLLNRLPGSVLESRRGQLFASAEAMWEKIRDERYCRERIGRVQIRRVASTSLTTHFTQFQKWGKAYGCLEQMPCQQSKRYLGIRYDPGMFSSSVARTAPFALASLLK
jgi:hypothetical protein